MHHLLRELQGGDLRSIGRSAAAVRAVIAKPDLARELVSGLQGPDPIVRMRCADVLEKVTKALPELAQRYKAALLSLLCLRQPKEVLWHLLQIAPRVKWQSSELAVIHAVVGRAHRNSSRIVRACALQAEVELLAQAPQRSQRVDKLLRSTLTSEVPALRARARRLLALVERHNLAHERRSS